jgi:heptosyltransferase-1
VRILLTRLSALGDIVHTWPVVAALRGAAEPPRVAWVVEAPLAPLVERHPAVDSVITVATAHWRRAPFSAATRAEIAEARRRARSFGADTALDPQGLCKSAVWGGLSGARRRIGLAVPWRRERLAGLLYTETIQPLADKPHVVDVNLSLLRAVGVPPPWGSEPDGRFLLGANGGPHAPAGAVALLPGAGRRDKSWPVERFVRLARRCADRGTPVTVVWGPGERRLAELIAAEAGAGVVVAPPTTIAELAGYLASCVAAVGGDTGPIHLAASLGIPTIALFVATDPARNGPRGRRVRIVSAAAEGAFRGRARTRTLREIPVDEVDSAVIELLGECRGKTS